MGVSAVLLSIVVVRTDLGQFEALVARTDLGWWTLGLTLVLITPVVSAQRIRLLARSLGHRVSLGSIAAVNLESMFFSLLIPGELAAGVVRWERFSRHTRNRAGALALLAAERLIDWLVLALTTAAGAPLLFSGGSAPRLRILTAILAVSGAALAGAAVLLGRSQLVARFLRTRQRRPERAALEAWAERLERLLRASHALSGDLRQTVPVLLWSVVYWSIALTGTLIMARAVFPQMPLLPYVAATAALVLLAQLPLTVAGMGLRELSLPVLLEAYGVTVEVGLAVGLSAFIPYALLGGVGWALRLAGRARLQEEASPPS